MSDVTVSTGISTNEAKTARDAIVQWNTDIVTSYDAVLAAAGKAGANLTGMANGIVARFAGLETAVNAMIAPAAKAAEGTAASAQGLTQAQQSASAASATAAQSMDALLGRYASLTQAQQQLAAGGAAITILQQATTLSASQEAAVLSSLEANQRALDVSQKAMGTSSEELAKHFQELKDQIKDTASSLLESQSPMAGFAELAGLAEPAIKTLKAMGIQLPTVGMAATVMAGGLAAAATAFGVVFAAGENFKAQTLEVATASRLTGGVIGETSGSLLAMAERAAEAGGISVASAREQQAVYIRTGEIGADSMERLIGLSRDYAAATKQDLSGASKDLAALFTDPVAGAKKLSDAYGLLSGQEMERIRQLKATGDEEEARVLLADKLAARTRGLGDKVGVLAYAWERVALAASAAYKAVGQAVAPETHDQAIARLEEERKKIPVGRRLTSLGSGGVLAANAEEIARHKAARAREREMAARVGAFQEQVKDSVSADEVAKSFYTLPAETEKIKQDITKLEAGLANPELMGFPDIAKKALEAHKNRLSDLEKLIADGTDLQTYKNKELTKIDTKYANQTDPKVAVEIAKEKKKVSLFGTATTNVQREDEVNTAGEAAQAAVTRGSAQATTALNQQTLAQHRLTAGVKETGVALSKQEKSHQEFADGIDRQVAANNRLTAAYGVSDQAVQDAARENEAYIQTLKEYPELAKNISAHEEQWTAAVNRNIDKLKERDLSKQAADIAAYSSKLRAAQEDLDVDRAVVGMSDLGAQDLKARHEALKALKLTRAEYAAMTGPMREQVDAQLNAASALAQQQQEVKNYADAWGTVTKTLEKSFEQVGTTLLSAITEGKSASIDFGKLWKGITSSMLSEFSKLALVDLRRLVGLGGNTQGSLLDLFSGMTGGSTQTANALQGGNQSSSLSGTLLSKAGGWVMDKVGLSGIGTNIAGAIDAWGATNLGIGVTANTATGILPGGGVTSSLTAPAGASTGLSGLLGGVGAGAAAGGIVGGLLGTATNSKAVGGLSGAAAGGLASYMVLGSAFGPWGTIAGAVVGAIMGALGTQKKSVGPNAAGNIYINSSGLKSGPAAGDNGMDGSAMLQVSDAVSKSVNTVIAGIGAKFVKTTEGAFAHFTMFQEGNKWAFSDHDGKNRQEFTSQEEFVNALLKRSIERLDADGRVSGISDDVRKALTNTKATKAEDLANDLGFAAGFRKQFDALNASLNPTNNQIKTMTDAAQELGKQVKTSIMDWRDKATELGLATDEQLTTAAKHGMDALMGLGPTVEPLRGIAAVTKQAEINFEALRPTLEALGYSADDITKKSAAYKQKLENDYIESITRLQSQGTQTIAALTDPLAKTSASDRLTNLGLDPKNSVIQELAAAITGVETAAHAGTLTMTSEKAALEQLNRRLGDGYLTADQYNAAVGMLTQAWQDSATAAAEATAKIEAGEDLKVRTLTALGKTTDADAFALQLKQQREYKAAVKAGYDEVYLANLKYVQSLEAQAAAAEKVAAATAKIEASEDLKVRTLTALGKTTDADALALQLKQQREYKAAEKAGYDEVYLANLKYVQSLEAQTAAAEKVAATESFITKIRQENAQETINSLNDQINTAKSAQSQWDNLVKSLGSFRSSLLQGDLSTLSPQQKLQEAAKQYQDALTKAQTGDVDAAGQVQSLAQAYLESARAYYASSGDYARIFNDVQAGLSGVESVASRQYNVATSQLATLNTSLKVQQDLLKELSKPSQTDVSTALSGLNASTLADLVQWGQRSGSDTLMQVLQAADAKLGQAGNPYHYHAPSDVQAIADHMTTQDYLNVGQDIGFTGTIDALNPWIVAYSKQSAFETAVKAWGARQVYPTTPTSPTTPTTQPLSPEQQYLAAYQDVAANGMSPALHYALFGAREGRNSYGMTLTRDQAYLARYSDVAEAYLRGQFTSGEQHYALFGQAEGRTYQRGGIVGNGRWGVDSVAAEYADGGPIWLAGGEYIMPANQTALYRPELDAMRAGTWNAANDRWSGVAEFRPRASTESTAGTTDPETKALLREACDKLDALIRVSAGAGDGTIDGLREVADGVSAMVKRVAGSDRR